jgi:CRP-like cAMP-binding protein
MSDEIFDLLPLFKGLNTEQRTLLRPLFEPCDYYADTALFEQGDPAEYIYLVVVGEISIRYKPEDGPEITLSHVRSGGVVGWSAALGNRLYTSAALCTVYTQTLRLRGADLHNLCREHPDTGLLILERLASIISERLRNTREQVMALLTEGVRARVSHA